MNRNMEWSGLEQEQAARIARLEEVVQAALNCWPAEAELAAGSRWRRLWRRLWRGGGCQPVAVDPRPWMREVLEV